jgi:ammonia channel protein AmtB
MKGLNITAYILVAIGVVIVIGTHIWLLMQGQLPKNQVVSHSVINIVGAVFIIVAWVLVEIKKKKDEKYRSKYGRDNPYYPVGGLAWVL